MSKTVLFQTIHFSVSAVSMSKTVLFQTIHFSISMKLSSILPIKRTLLCATISGQSGPGSDGNEKVLRIPLSSSITVASPSDCIVSYLGHLLGVVLPLCRENSNLECANTSRTLQDNDFIPGLSETHPHICLSSQVHLPIWVDKYISSYVIEKNKFLHIVLCVLVVCHLKFTLQYEFSNL